MHLDKLKAEIEADIARELTFAPPHPRPVPQPPQASVKLNTAAILREDALYRHVTECCIRWEFCGNHAVCLDLVRCSWTPNLIVGVPPSSQKKTTPGGRDAEEV